MARAQFFLSSTDDSRLKWRSVSSANFEVIYPVGCDSLARVYLDELEAQRPRTASSLGMAANDGCRKPLPVVLHVQNASANGMVTWTPRRMELNTLPEWGTPSPMPWTTMLSIHEGRHATQMANGYRKVFKPFYYAFGQIIPGIAAGWPGKLFLEGDAVIAETALSSSGRGRSAAFLGYYNYAFDNGDMRGWMKWRLGSYYKYTPNHYAFGYTLLSGIRTRYDAPLFMSDYFDYVSRRPYDPWPFRHVLRKTSGKKFKESYPEILTANYDAWAADTTSRKPFMPLTVFSCPTARLTQYTNPNSSPDGGYLWVKKDLYHTPAVVELGKDGKEKKLFSIGDEIGKINFEESDSTMVWNEVRKDPRWGQKRHSIVRSYDFRTGKLRDITHYGAYIYPIKVTSDRVAAIHYLQNGNEHIDMLDKGSGAVVGSIAVPDSLQILEMTHIGHSLYAVGISACGSGIYRCSFDSPSKYQWNMVLPPHPFAVLSLDHDGECLVFESDRTGVNEYYRYNVVSGVLTQMTSSKYGAIDYNLCPDGSVSYSLLCDHGSCAAVTYANELVNRVVEWDDYYHYAVADKLSAQEKALAARGDSLAGVGGGDCATSGGRGNSLAGVGGSFAKAGRGDSCADGDAASAGCVDSLAGVGGSLARAGRSDSCADGDAASAGCVDSLAGAGGVEATPKRYRKIGHGIRLHSWAPLYADYNAISSMSVDNIKNLAHLGAMAFFQNDMSTFYGWVGYQAKLVEAGKGDGGGSWRNVGHLNLTYSGLYPEFVGELHLNEQAARNYTYDDANNKVYYSERNAPRIRTTLTVRIPLSWDNGVIQYGVIPYVGIGYTNDYIDGRVNVMYNVNARAYVTQHTPSAAVYPRLGIGAEGCWTGASTWGYLYGYVPGVGWGQGLRLSLLAQMRLQGGLTMIPSSVNLMPCGYGFTSAGFLNGFKASANYAAPFPIGDWHIADAFYCKRGIFTPHFDCSWLNSSQFGIPYLPVELGSDFGTLWSAGFTFELEFGSFFWVRTPITVGFTYSYNGGNLYEYLGFKSDNRNYIGATFGISL